MYDSPVPFHIRSADESDVPLIFEFIRDLARYEKLEHKVVATEDSLRASLFGNPRLLKRSFCPVFVPDGTLRRTGPPNVGTSTLAPSAASHGASGRSR